MMKNFIGALCFFTLLILSPIQPISAAGIDGKSPMHLPLVITKNTGMTHQACNYFIRGGSSNIFFQPHKVTYQFVRNLNREAVDEKIKNHSAQTLAGSVELMNMDVEFVNANASSFFEESDPLDSKTNYLVGTDAAAWKTDIKDFKTLVYKEIYNNIDVKYYSTNEKIKYDFVVKPGGNIKDIVLKYAGIEKLEAGKNGDLIIHNKLNDLVENIPLAYQDIDGKRNIVQAQYHILDQNKVCFQVPSYDKNYPLVIDPALFYSTLIGGTGDDQFRLGAMAKDNQGNIYCTGWTSSLDFPVTPGAYNVAYSGGAYDAFALKLNKDGSNLIYSTFFGSSELDGGYGIDIDNSTYEAYITGFTYGAFPTTPGCYQSISNATPVAADMFALKLNSTGTAFIYSTLIGGVDEEIPMMLKKDIFGNVYIAGEARATLPFPIPGGSLPYQAANAGDLDGFVCVLNNSGTALLGSTYLGGALKDGAQGIALDAASNVYVLSYTAGGFPVTPGSFGPVYNGGTFDMAVTKFDASLSNVLYSGYLGGPSDDMSKASLKVDGGGEAYVTGIAGPGFPTTPGAYSSVFAGGVSDAFVSKVDFSGASLVYSTYLGGSGDDGGYNLDVNNSGEVFVTGFCASNFPVTSCAYDKSYNGGSDVFISKLNSSGSGLVYSSYFGGSAYERGSAIVADADTVYVIGESQSVDFPTTPAAFQQNNSGGTNDIFALKLLLDVSPVVSFTKSAKDICLGDTILFKNASTAATSFHWDFGDGNGSSAWDTSYVYSAPGTYYVTLIGYNSSCNDTLVDSVIVNAVPVLASISDTSVCQGQSILLTASGGNGYEWSGGISAQTQNVNVSPTLTTDYYVVAYNGGCRKDTDTITVAVYKIPNLSLTGQSNLCKGDTVTLTSSSTDSVMYQWSGGGISNTTPVVKVNPSLTTTYTIDVTDTNGCVNTSSIPITVKPYPVFTTLGNGTQICDGESMIISALGNSSYQYYWVETKEITMSITVTPTDTTTYHIQVTDGFCSLTDSIRIIVHPMPSVSISGPKLMCLGDLITIKATGGLIYHWDPYASTADSIMVSPQSDTTFMVIAEAYTCQSPPVFLDVMVADSVVKAIISPSIDPCGDNVLFSDASLNSRTYLWQFHDGTESTSANATHSYDISGIYPVSLVINRGVGCSDSTTYLVDYWSNHLSDIYIPNAFTPNFDGMNEKFEILGNVECFYNKLQIIDRWGMVIFETDKPGSDFWDGKVNMKAVPEGVYHYILSGKKYSRTGMVTIIKAY